MEDLRYDNDLVVNYLFLQDWEQKFKKAFPEEPKVLELHGQFKEMRKKLK